LPVIQVIISLSSSGVPQDAVPEDIKNKMPRLYDKLLVILIGRVCDRIVSFKERG